MEEEVCVRVREKWPITQLECLALLTGIRENHVYLASRPFAVYTDHISLKFLESLKISPITVSPAGL